ncbi:MAG: hypothetical protein WBA57_01335 [Elainellaceae cyanobacterium]
MCWRYGLRPGKPTHQTAVLAEESLTLELHPLDLVTVPLTDQWVTGSLMVMVQ